MSFFMRSLLGAIAAISVISSPALARFDTPAFVKCSFNGVMERCKVGFDTDGSFYVEWLKDGHWTVYRFSYSKSSVVVMSKTDNNCVKGSFSLINDVFTVNTKNGVTKLYLPTWKARQVYGHEGPVYCG